MVLDPLLPKGYPRSVAASYGAYSLRAALGLGFSSAAGVLATQSLLHAVGVGVGAAPLAATLNWVLKDGLGQLGGVLFAGLVNSRFDRDVKRWRFAAAATLEAASLLELGTAFAPTLFLPLAALANVGKNVAWLSASATRAGIHQSLARAGNMADVTAKAGSQSIAASLGGMGLGIALSSVLAAPGTMQGVVVWAILASLHLLCVHSSLQHLALPTLNHSRLITLLQHHLSHPTLPLPSPEQVAEAEQWWHETKAKHIKVNPAIHTLKHLKPALEQHVATPSHNPSTNTHQTQSKYLHTAYTAHREDAFVSLLIHEGAQWSDVLHGFTHAYLLQHHSAMDPEEVQRIARETAPIFVEKLQRAQWWVGQPLVETNRKERVKVYEEGE